MLSIGPLLDRVLVVGIVVAIIAFLAVGILRRSRTFVILAAINSVGLVAATQTVPLAIPQIARSSAAYAIIGATAAVSYVALVQQPAWLAERLGFKHRSREREFDQALWQLVEEFNSVLQQARAAEPETALLLRSRAEAILHDLTSLGEPSAPWAELRDRYVELVRLHIAAWGQPLSAEAKQGFVDRNEHATAERERLREAYRAEARTGFRWP